MIRPTRCRSAAPIVTAVCLLAVLAHGARLSACNVPVFRYALERWAPDLYVVTVFHRGPWADDARAAVDELETYLESDEKQSNIDLHLVDLDGEVHPEEEDLWEKQGDVPLPHMVVEFPLYLDEPEPLWTGPLTTRNVATLMDSPARREIARRILKGESAVFLLVLSGDEKRDAAFEKRLQARLDFMEKELRLPTLTPDDFQYLNRSGPPAGGPGSGRAGDPGASLTGPKLKLDFSVLRVRRSDKNEAMLVAMLTGDPDADGKAPELILAPVFGQGRALGLLHENEADDDTIAEVCAFLVGPCSCRVKEQNPGFDLLISVAWRNFLQGEAVVDKELPPLTGLPTLARAKPAADPQAALGSAAGPQTPDMETKPVEAGAPSHLLTGTLAVLAIGLALLVVATVLVPRGAQKG